MDLKVHVIKEKSPPPPKKKLNLGERSITDEGEEEKKISLTNLHACSFMFRL